MKWTETTKNAGRELLWFIAQLVVFIICIAYIQFFYYQNIEPDKRVKEDFTQTNCTLLDKQLAERGKIVKVYRSNYLVSYLVNGTVYQEIATGNGLDRSYAPDRESQEEMQAQFAIGQNYPCWFNPENPAIIVLILRHHWSSTFPLIVPSIIAIITLIYLLENIFNFCMFFFKKN